MSKPTDLQELTQLIVAVDLNYQITPGLEGQTLNHLPQRIAEKLAVVIQASHQEALQRQDLQSRLNELERLTAPPGNVDGKEFRSRHDDDFFTAGWNFAWGGVKRQIWERKAKLRSMTSDAPHLPPASTNLVTVRGNIPAELQRQLEAKQAGGGDE